MDNEASVRTRRKHNYLLTERGRACNEEDTTTLGQTLSGQILHFIGGIGLDRKKHNRSSEVCLRILVRSKLEYCSCVWSPKSAVGSSALERIKKLFLSFLYFNTFYNVSSCLFVFLKCGSLNIDILSLVSF